MASDVFFSDMRTDFGNNLLDKLRKVIRKAGIGNIDFQDHYAAIKMHFGEPGNLAFLRPNWAKVVADEVKSLGGKPFLTDFFPERQPEFLRRKADLLRGTVKNFRQFRLRDELVVSPEERLPACRKMR